MKKLLCVKPYLAIFLIVSLLACSGGGGGDDSGSDSQLSNDSCDVLGIKIFSGTTCSAVNRSPVVRVQILYPNNQLALCSGTLISPTDILTAGHCFRFNGTALGAAAEIGETLVPLEWFAIHPNYREDEALQVIFDDVAILHLSQPASIHPVPLLLSSSVSAGEIIDIFGYGQDEQGIVGTLQSGQMLLSAVTPSHLFADYDGNGSNTCFGDSGGPAIITAANGEPAIVGVTSTGIEGANCAPGDKSAFANTQSDSIQSFILSLVPSAAVI